MNHELILRFLTRYRGSLLLVLLASILLNLIVFSGSIYMMLVYDSALPSRSIPTLLGLFGMLALIYGFQALFEGIRSEALLGIANGIHDDLFRPVHYATTSQPLRGAVRDGDGMQPVRDLDQIHSFLAGPGLIALIDLPWVLLFLAVLTALHWSLGLTALAGALVLGAIAIWTSRRTAAGTRQLSAIVGRRAASTQAELHFVESAVAMGMRDRLLARSSAFEQQYVASQTFLSRTVARLGSAGRVLRLLLQSLILTVGALLVIDDKASAGVILAASVLTGRALAPVDQAIANWRVLTAARTGWNRIVDTISASRPPQPRSIALSPPKGTLMLRDVWIRPPGSANPVIGGVSFALLPGQALAIIGPSAAGKTSLAKALVGIWPAARGEVRIDGATYDQWDPDILGACIGYVPQAVELIEGTIGENIARFDPEASSQGVIAAARAAGMHEAILAMADGYETRVTTGGFELSAGQRQRIGLARALYGDPFLIVLDEPNSNLDAAGDGALASAIAAVRQRKGIVVMITHRPATLQPVSHVAVLTDGKLTDFGERDDVLQRMAKPASGQIRAEARTREASSA